MPRYRITAPDGRVFDIQAPDGASQDDALNYAKAQWAGIPGRSYPLDINQNIAENSPDKSAVRSLPFGDSLPVNGVTASLGAATIGAGRTLDKLQEGVRQIGLSSQVQRPALGLPARPVLSAQAQQELSQQAQQQKGMDEAYAPLAKSYPFSTGVGEALPALAIPVGQETALARIMAPALGLSAMEGAKYGTPQQRGLNAVKGLALGALGGGVGEIANSVISPATSALSSAQQSAVNNAAGKLGVNPLPSQLTGNANLAKIEDMLAGKIGSADVMRQFQQNNQRTINRAAAGAMGENSDDITRDVFAAAKMRQGMERDALLQGQTMPVTQPVFDAIDQSQQMLAKGLKQVDGKDSALGLLSDLKDRLYNSKQLSSDELQAITSDLKTAARSTNNQTIAAALKNVQRAMDDASTVDKTALGKSNKEIAARKDLQLPGAVNEYTGNVNPVTLANRLGTKYGESAKTGAINGPLFDIAEYGKSLPPMRTGSPTFQREEAASLMSYLLSPAYYLAAKGLTSNAGRAYLSGGLLGNPGLSTTAGKVASRAALPLAVSPAEQALFQMGLLGYSQ